MIRLKKDIWRNFSSTSGSKFIIKLHIITDSRFKRGGLYFDGEPFSKMFEKRSVISDEGPDALERLHKFLSAGKRRGYDVDGMSTENARLGNKNCFFSPVQCSFYYRK
ncbi:hypothetical protein AB6A40_010319 [Gnathostoma spinigerum]|uniref:Uncharacterized protein n=1 Tax=Gnathostoma spinigerum TaxID=75299 RepID=A0ABD6F340_9BILA